tara:strand:+ start:5465 stop:5902 length:438 start_codon:yes stop_codon:yes gene_type:complete
MSEKEYEDELRKMWGDDTVRIIDIRNRFSLTQHAVAQESHRLRLGKKKYARGRKLQPDYVPTPEEIRKECERIRETWDALTYLKRAGIPVESVVAGVKQFDYNSSNGTFTYVGQEGACAVDERPRHEYVASLRLRRLDEIRKKAG